VAAGVLHPEGLVDVVDLAGDTGRDVEQVDVVGFHQRVDIAKVKGRCGNPAQQGESIATEILRATVPSLTIAAARLSAVSIRPRTAS